MGNRLKKTRDIKEYLLNDDLIFDWEGVFQ